MLELGNFSNYFSCDRCGLRKNKDYDLATSSNILLYREQNQTEAAIGGVL